MRRPIALALAVALLAVPASMGSTGNASSGGAVAAKAKKKCSKKHRRSAAASKKRRCRRPGSLGGAQAPAAGDKEDPCPNTPSSPGRLAARESEYQIVLSRPSLGCGTSIVEQDNLGEDPHDLVLQKVGAPAMYSFPELAPGGVAKRTLELGRGTWTLYCSLPGHYDLGMHANLEVN